MAYENLYTRVDAELKKVLDEFCAQHNISIREVVENSLKDYLAARGKFKNYPTPGEAGEKEEEKNEMYDS